MYLKMVVWQTTLVLHLSLSIYVSETNMIQRHEPYRFHFVLSCYSERLLSEFVFKQN